LELNERPAGERYDLVLGDAFNDIAVPYHLTTKEFNEKVSDHLSPRGIYLATSSTARTTTSCALTSKRSPRRSARSV
jgi:spermidine synthase